LKPIRVVNYKKLIIVLLVVLVPVGLWATQRYASSDGGLPPLHTERVERGDVSRRVVAHGSIQPVQRVEVGSQVSGIVDAVLVDFNSVVRKGQVIARIDPSTFAAAVASAQAELESAQASLELARHQWQRVQALREQQLVPPSDVEEARANLRQAEAEVGVRRHALNRARRELERCTITAPADGIVISRSVDVGQTVAASLSAPVLFEIASDLRRMHIHARVSEADIGSVSEGQEVRFVVDAHRGREFRGEIVQVRNAPLVEDNVVHYETIITAANDEGLLKPGMTAEVAIITAERQNVLRLRNTALRARLPDALVPAGNRSENADGPAVFRLVGGELMHTPVQTGLSDGVYTEILAGLDEGDVLAVGLSLASEQNRGGGARSVIGGSQAQF
jgi:HlyD family secretion protein